jgi:DNA polymerase II large subunit
MDEIEIAFIFLSLFIPCVIVAIALTDVRDFFRKRMRRDEGQCVHCGYDLRGSQQSVRCPECGDLLATIVVNQSE